MKLSMVFQYSGLDPPEVLITTVRGVVEIQPKKVLVEFVLAERILIGSMPLSA